MCSHEPGTMKPYSHGVYTFHRTFVLDKVESCYIPFERSLYQYARVCVICICTLDPLSTHASELCCSSTPLRHIFATRPPAPFLPAEPTVRNSSQICPGG